MTPRHGSCTNPSSSPTFAQVVMMPFHRIAVAFAFAALCSNAFAQADGKYLTILGDCAGCHTNAGGELYAGGRAMTSPFGTFYTSNVTPDRETGTDGEIADVATYMRNSWTVHPLLRQNRVRDLRKKLAAEHP
jgi:mono/diheme cytochrome c family protein